MRWAFQIAKPSGIGVYVHVTFLLLLAFVAYSGYVGTEENPGSINDAVTHVIVVILIFWIIVLHELGHALAARRYGIATQDIVLYPIGGLARLERLPDKPWQEFVVAIAGPAVNIALAAILFVLLKITGELGVADSMMSLNGMLAINIILALFNFLPAYPMDGGRILRALLAMVMDYVVATKIATRVGQGMAICFFILAIFAGMPLLFFIGLMVFMGAQQEASTVQYRLALQGVRIEDLTDANYPTVHAQTSIAEARQIVSATRRTDLPVVRDGSLVGIVRAQDIEDAMRDSQEEENVESIMVSSFPTIDVADPIEVVIQSMRLSKLTTLPVVRNGAVIGVLTAERIQQQMQDALGNRA